MTREQNVNHLSNQLGTIRAKLDMACIDSNDLGLTNILDNLATAFNAVVIADEVLTDYIHRNAAEFTREKLFEPLAVPAISDNLFEAMGTLARPTTMDFHSECITINEETN